MQKVPFGLDYWYNKKAQRKALCFNQFDFNGFVLLFIEVGIYLVAGNEREGTI